MKPQGRHIAILFRMLLVPAIVLSAGHVPGAFAVSWPGVSAVKMSGGLVQPVHITHPGDGSGRLFAVEQGGRIRIIRADALVAKPFLDITDRVLFGGERGLLSVAFPPGFAQSGRFYVDYTRRTDGATVIARYRVTGDADVADHASEEVLLVAGQPFANHNGGQLAFGPDGFLYVGMGDGGSGGDPFNNAQSPFSLLGKMLRIDVESAAPLYAVPPDNPFARGGGLPEIWSLGLRNPWRFSFDRLTGDLYIGDVGQNLYEEIDYQPAAGPGGENYGWHIMEASHCYLTPSCSSAGLTLPVAEYDHSQGDCAVTGGMVYRGAKYPDLQGLYFYGDYCSGRVRGLRAEGGQFSSIVLLDLPFGISTFGDDEDGNLYLANYASGDLYRVIADVAGIPAPAARRTFVFPVADSPVAGTDPGQLNPFGFGPFAAGGDALEVQIALGRFDAPVDIYLAYAFSGDSGHIFVLGPDHAFRPFTLGEAQQVLGGAPVSGLLPWIQRTSGPVDVNPITLSSANLAPGVYTVYLLITPAGTLDSYYLGRTSLVIP